MSLDLLIATTLGILTGIITGLTPGIHVNLVSLLVLSFSSVLLTITTPLSLGAFIISLAITHTFLDTLPSIYLGAPTDAKALNVLPGHRFLLRGDGHLAVLYTILGSLGSVILSVLLFPLFIIGMQYLSDAVSKVVGYALIIIMGYMILKEKEKKIKCLILFLLSGVLGLCVFAIPHLSQPLFPLLSGLFGFSILFMSLLEKSTIPKQNTKAQMNISKTVVTKAVGTATGMGFIAAFLPGFGSSQAAIIGTNIVGDIGDEGFLTLVGGINTANMLISIATAYAIEKSRNGAIVVINKLLEGITFETMLIFIAVSLVAAGVATLLTIKLSKVFAKLIVKVNYQKLIWSIIIFITFLTFVFDGPIGLTILITATALGLLGSVWRVGKNHLMGCLIVPVILYFIL